MVGCSIKLLNDFTLSFPQHSSALSPSASVRYRALCRTQCVNLRACRLTSIIPAMSFKYNDLAASFSNWLCIAFNRSTESHCLRRHFASSPHTIRESELRYSALSEKVLRSVEFNSSILGPGVDVTAAATTKAGMVTLTPPRSRWRPARAGGRCGSSRCGPRSRGGSGGTGPGSARRRRRRARRWCGPPPGW